MNENGREAGKRGRPSRRSTPDVLRPAAAGPTAETPKLADGDTFYEARRRALVVQNDFGLLEREARANLWNDLNASDRGTAARDQAAYWAAHLYEVTRRAIEELVKTDRAAAAQLAEVYIIQVIPRAERAGQVTPDVRRMLRDANLLSEFSRDWLEGVGASDEEPPVDEERALATVPAGADEDVEIEGSADELPVVAEAPAGEGPAIRPGLTAQDPQDARHPDWMAEVTYEDILRHCARARVSGRKSVVVVGMASTGKTFLRRRLKERLGRRGFNSNGSKGLAPAGDGEVKRTMDILLHKFDPVTPSRPSASFDLYDMPGDWFVKQVRSGGQVPIDGVDDTRLIYAIYAFADAVIFIAPALHVLKRATFEDHGDDLGMSPDQIRERLIDMETFIDSMGPLSAVIRQLRESLATNLREAGKKPADPDATPVQNKGKAEKVKKKVDALIEAANKAVDKALLMTFDDIQQIDTKAKRIRMPALLLLSRADELERRLPDKALVNYDADPAGQLIMRNKELFDTLSGRFDSFAVDFVTSQVNATPTQEFYKNGLSFGVGELIHGWLDPALNACRQPGMIRWLHGPSVAVKIRRALDPNFRLACTQQFDTQH